MTQPDLFSQGTEPKPHTQTWHALQALRQGPVCSFSFYHYPGLTHRLPARIGDLKRMGWDIHSRVCESHSHRSRAVEYVLM